MASAPLGVLRELTKLAEPHVQVGIRDHGCARMRDGRAAVGVQPKRGKTGGKART